MIKSNKVLAGIGLIITMLVYGFSSSCTAQSTASVDYDKAFLVDVRTPAEYQEGSAKGAVNIPLNELQNHLNEFKDKEQIVVFCRSGARSGQAKKILERNGITNVINGSTWMDVDRAIQQNKTKK
ncbi:MAG: rhodanese-like domain-containing protein [Flavobacteriales bacterium]